MTGLLSTLEGTHNLTAKLLGVTTGSSWLVGGSLLLYTRDNAPAAAAPVTSFAAGSPHVVSGTHSYAEFANDSFEAQSSFGAGATATTVTLFANTSYANVDLTPNGWENLTMVEHVWQSVVTDSNGTRVVADTNWTFLLSVDLASVFVPNAGQGTGYPIYGNVTEYMLNLRQVWNETGLTWSIGTSGAALPASYSVEYSVTGGNNLFIGTEELISANAAQLTSITFVESSTSAEYRATSVVEGLAWEFDHLVAGERVHPPAPDQAETVSVNEIVSPIDAGLVTSRPGGRCRRIRHPIGAGGRGRGGLWVYLGRTPFGVHLEQLRDARVPADRPRDVPGLDGRDRQLGNPVPDGHYEPRGGAGPCDCDRRQRDRRRFELPRDIPS